MAEIVNLNRVRKARAKAEAELRAAANRVKHGRDKAQQANDRAADERRARLLDGAQRDEVDPRRAADRSGPAEAGGGATKQPRSPAEEARPQAPPLTASDEELGR